MWRFRECVVACTSRSRTLQWIPSSYLLTYGAFMLIGGRAADLLGRHRVLVTGTSFFALASIVAGLAGNSGVLTGARLAQGAGAAMVPPLRCRS